MSVAEVATEPAQSVHSSASSAHANAPQPIPRSKSDGNLAKIEKHSLARVTLGPILAARFPHLQHKMLGKNNCRDGASCGSYS
eukprot:10817008-Karenia_brevis.AAC.1